MQALLSRVLVSNQSCQRNVRVDGQEVEFDWQGGGFHWEAGDRLVISNDGLQLDWIAYTLDGGQVVEYWSGTFQRSAADQPWNWTGQGRVNCFGLGFFKLDEAYLLEYLQELVDADISF